MDSHFSHGTFSPDGQHRIPRHGESIASSAVVHVIFPIVRLVSFVVLLLPAVPLGAAKSPLVHGAVLHTLDEGSLMAMTQTIFTSTTIVGAVVCFRFFLTGCLSLSSHTQFRSSPGAVYTTTSFQLKTQSYLCGLAVRLHDSGASGPKTQTCENGFQSGSFLETMPLSSRCKRTSARVCENDDVPRTRITCWVYRRASEDCVCAAEDFAFIDASPAECRFTASLLRPAETRLLHTRHH